MKKFSFFILVFFSVFTLSFGQNHDVGGQGIMYIDQANGLIGINQSSPVIALQVEGNVVGAVGRFTNTNPNGWSAFALFNDVNNAFAFGLGGSNSATFANTGYISTVHSIPLTFGTANAEKVRILPNGNMGIGTTNPSEKLCVDGQVLCEEAKVVNDIEAPDYVFKNDYNLRSLEEVEAYINENSHLPEIPSAAEFSEEGIHLGKMSFDLLKKVEELTLYIIDLKKEQKKLQNQIEKLTESK